MMNDIGTPGRYAQHGRCPASNELYCAEEPVWHRTLSPVLTARSGRLLCNRVTDLFENAYSFLYLYFILLLGLNIMRGLKRWHSNNVALSLPFVDGGGNWI